MGLSREDRDLFNSQICNSCNKSMKHNRDNKAFFISPENPKKGLICLRCWKQSIPHDQVKEKLSMINEQTFNLLFH